MKRNIALVLRGTLLFILGAAVGWMISPNSLAYSFRGEYVIANYEVADRSQKSFTANNELLEGFLRAIDDAVADQKEKNDDRKLLKLDLILRGFDPRRLNEPGPNSK
jgi:hypothetical protein